MALMMTMTAETLTVTPMFARTVLITIDRPEMVPMISLLGTRK